MTSESTITVPTMLSRMNFSVTQTIHAQHHHHHRRQLICTNSASGTPGPITLGGGATALPSFVTYHLI